MKELWTKLLVLMENDGEYRFFGYSLFDFSEDAMHAYATDENAFIPQNCGTL